MNTRIVAASLFTLLGLVGTAAAQDAPVGASDQAATTADAAQVTTTETTGNTLLIERVSEENKASMPARGMTMAQINAEHDES